MVIDYLIGKIVQQATLWVSKTLASGGFSVILDAIKAVYDALQVVAQYLKQMLEVANSVCEGIMDIAKGVLGKAADTVESAAARLIPAVLAFLARTLGIGDLPEVIGEGVKKVRKTVEDAIDKLIDKTFAAMDWLKQKGKEAVSAVLGWLGLSEPIPSTDGESHSIYMDKATEKLMVASTPADIDNTMKMLGDADAQAEVEAKPHATAAQTAITKLKTLKNKSEPGNKSATDDKQTGELTSQLNAAMKALAGILGRTLFSADDAISDLPKTEIQPMTDSQPARNITALLSANRSEGSAPNDSPDGWKQISQANLTGRENWVQLHVINKEFGGLGVKSNLVPGTKQNNSDHRWAMEEPLKALLGPKAKAPGKKKPRSVLWCTAAVTYYGSSATKTKFLTKYGLSPAIFATSIRFEWGLYKREQKGKQKPTFTEKTARVGSFVLTPIPLPGFTDP
jgi:hypothetical protein